MAKKKEKTNEPLPYEQKRQLRSRLGARAWPPRCHKYPITFSRSNETIGLLKSVSVDLSEYYKRIYSKYNSYKNGNRSHWVCDQLKTFDLSFYLPINILGTSNQKVNTVVIMINGLNEIFNANFMHYDRMGLALASRGIGVILHPSPFHLNRAAYMKNRFKGDWEKHHSTGEERYQTWSEGHGADTTSRLPHHSMIRHPECIFHCFKQISDEVIALTEFLHGKRNSSCFDDHDSSSYDRFFKRDDNLQAILLGYSFGGLEALFTFLKEPDLFSHCILFNSGAAIDKLRTKPVHISNKEWHQIVQSILKERTRLPTEILANDRELLDEIFFNRPFLGTTSIESFCNSLPRLLFIAGGADIVSPSEYVLQFIKKDIACEHIDNSKFNGLNVLQICGLEHHLQDSPQYDQWFPVIINTIESFVKVKPSPGPQISKGEVVRFFSKVKIGKKPFEVALKTMIDDDDLNFKGIEKVFEKIEKKEKQKIIEMYMVSKRFFANDSELLRTINRERSI